MGRAVAIEVDLAVDGLAAGPAGGHPSGLLLAEVHGLVGAVLAVFVEGKRQLVVVARQAHVPSSLFARLSHATALRKTSHNEDP